jgi:hypothetical protein
VKAAAGALFKSDPSDGGPVVQVRLLPGPYRGFRLNILAPAYTGLMRPQFHAHHYLAIAPPASTSNRRSPTFPCYQSHRIASHPIHPHPRPALLPPPATLIIVFTSAGWSKLSARYTGQIAREATLHISPESPQVSHPASSLQMETHSQEHLAPNGR